MLTLALLNIALIDFPFFFPTTPCAPAQLACLTVLPKRVSRPPLAHAGIPLLECSLTTRLKNYKLAIIPISNSGSPTNPPSILLNLSVLWIPTDMQMSQVANFTFFFFKLDCKLLPSKNASYAFLNSVLGPAQYPRQSSFSLNIVNRTGI